MSNDSKIFRKVFVDNMKDYYETEKVSGYIYLTEGQEKPNEGTYIENHLYILENNPKLTQDKAYHLFLDRTDYESDNIKELEGYLFEWAKGDYHNGKYEIIDESDLIEVYFGFIEGWHFDHDLKIYKGYKTKTDNTWNGWLVPFVTKHVRDQIIKDCDVNNPELWDDESIEHWKEYIAEKPNEKGLYCVGYGICWEDFDLDDLREAYKNYCKQEKLECIDAQEYLFQSTKCTKKQYEWIKNFCVVWDMIESKESE